MSPPAKRVTEIGVDPQVVELVAAIAGDRVPQVVVSVDDLELGLVGLLDGAGQPRSIHHGRERSWPAHRRAIRSMSSWRFAGMTTVDVRLRAFRMACRIHQTA